MTFRKKLWAGIGMLALLSPLGLLIPALFGAGGAWGEWGLEAVEDLTGYLPEGMKKLAPLWKSPLPDYTLPGQGEGMARESLGYVLNALIGVALTAGCVYLYALFLRRRQHNKRDGA